MATPLFRKKQGNIFSEHILFLLIDTENGIPLCDKKTIFLSPLTQINRPKLKSNWYQKFNALP